MKDDEASRVRRTTNVSPDEQRVVTECDSSRQTVVVSATTGVVYGNGISKQFFSVSGRRETGFMKREPTRLMRPVVFSVL